jgi:tetratricopeptide (TPR) repeat protein
MIQTAVTSNFLISDSLGWYIQGLLASCENYYTLRQFERIEAILETLEYLPLTQSQRERFLCYKAFVCKKKGHTDQARHLLEGVADRSVRAMLFLGTLHCKALRFDEARRYYREALKISPNELQAHQALAIVESLDGNHKGSLRELERLLPLALSVKVSQPTVYLDHLNSLAVELGEVGRIQEAGCVSQIVLASPYAFAYPEWRETGQDLALRGYRSRSSVRILQTFPGNVLPMPLREPSATSAHTAIFGDAPVVSLKEWKENKMVKEPNGNDDETNPDKMSEQDMVLKLIQMVTTGEGDEKKIRELLKSALKIFYGK